MTRRWVQKGATAALAGWLAGCGGSSSALNEQAWDAGEVKREAGPSMREGGLDGSDTEVAEAGPWRLVWSDEFEGPAGASVDRGQWTFDVGNGGWGNAELENYTDRASNAALDGSGALVITALRESLAGSAYTSARLKTQGLFTFTFGRVEARLQVPRGQGMWSAFWLLGSDIGSAGWPACGEIDVMENLGREPNVVHGTIHGPGYSGGGGPTAQRALPGGLSYADDFHVFAIEWTADAIAFAVDDEVYATQTRARLPAGKAWVFDHPFFLLLNLAVGGTWPGAPDATTTFPQAMRVDYVRVLQR